MKVCPLIAPPEGFHAESLTNIWWSRGSCHVHAWWVFYVDGEMIEHHVRCMTAGTASVSPESALIDSGDARDWAEREAIRKAMVTANRYAAYIVNRYRRGRILITQSEMDEWRKYHQREFQRRKRADSGDLVDQAASGDLRPIMRPLEFVEWLRGTGA